ncbi:hypothetical protein ACIRFH_34190 [Streptomyces sp. NPDC093586]|uniref:hypothetical protein n=1 Tax=Streptomyces sp. NPDC093586 TaxID=3366042 RepID=UPI0037FFF49B
MDPEDGGTGVADDEIIAGRILLGVKALRDHLGCSLHEALDAYSTRYEQLRRERPADFSSSHEDYWKNFHS